MHDIQWLSRKGEKAFSAFLRLRDTVTAREGTLLLSRVGISVQMPPLRKERFLPSLTGTVSKIILHRWFFLEERKTPTTFMVLKISIVSSEHASVFFLLFY